MIVDFGDQKITDDTKKIAEADVFLLTKRNEKYFKQLKEKPNFIKVSELIREWGLEEMQFIGITGTNGKTTVATAIAYVLNKLGYPTANQGTSGFFINDEKMVDKNRTTPEILEILHNAKLARDKGVKYFVMEVSSHAIAQNRIEGIDFKIKIHTNITSDHLDYHKTVEEYRKIKNSFLADKTTKIINLDDEFVKFNSENTITYSWDKQEADFGIKELDLQTSLVGRFNLYNLTAAVVTVKKLLPKISVGEIKNTLSDFLGMPGRMEVISREPLIIVDFAHTADGMEKILTAFEDENDLKKISVVFGAGGGRDHNRRAPVGAVIDKYADRIYLTTDNPRTERPEDIIDQILGGIKNRDKVEIILDRRRAIRTAIRDLDRDTILLILGKGDEAYQEINNQRIPWSDEKVIREFLK